MKSFVFDGDIAADPVKDCDFGVGLNEEQPYLTFGDIRINVGDKVSYQVKVVDKKHQVTIHKVVAQAR